MIDEQSLDKYEEEIKLKESDIDSIRSEELEESHFVTALFFAVLSGIIMAVLWAVIGALTETEFGIFVIAVGAVVGYVVRKAGNGRSKGYGVMGALVSILSCALGSVFLMVYFLSQEVGLNIFEIFPLLYWSEILKYYVTTIDFMNVLFFLFAAYEGYRLSIVRPQSDTSSSHI